MKMNVVLYVYMYAVLGLYIGNAYLNYITWRVDIHKLAIRQLQLWHCILRHRLGTTGRVVLALLITEVVATHSITAQILHLGPSP